MSARARRMIDFTVGLMIGRAVALLKPTLRLMNAIFTENQLLARPGLICLRDTDENVIKVLAPTARRGPFTRMPFAA